MGRSTTSRRTSRRGSRSFVPRASTSSSTMSAATSSTRLWRGSRCEAASCCAAGSRNYNATEPAPGPKNYLNLVGQRGRMEGFIILDYLPRAHEAIGALAGWVQAGKIRHKVDVQHGLENAPAALRRLFDGHNDGKQLLRVAE